MNYITHLFGLALSLIGVGILFWSSLLSDSSDIWNRTSCAVYSITLVGMYAASTFYHRCRIGTRKKTWKIVDHICIYLFIAGSYTPFTLGPLRDRHGVELFCVVWAVAIFGIIFKIAAIDSFKKLSLLSYLLLGWLVIFSFPALARELSGAGLTCLVAGGVAYTLGTLFYSWQSLPFNHAIWHLFVLGGSGCHYFSIWGLYQPS